VADELEGRGIGGALVRAAVEHAADTGLTVVPQCPFAAHWIESHPNPA
jgi:predicted GNAT family acetyltransferase